MSSVALLGKRWRRCGSSSKSIQQYSAPDYATYLLQQLSRFTGHVTVVDHDSVELSNLHRQVLHTEASVGVPKAVSAQRAIQECVWGQKLLLKRVPVALLNNALESLCTDAIHPFMWSPL